MQSGSYLGEDDIVRFEDIYETVQQQIIDKKLKFYVINGDQVAKDTGMGGRINTIMQTCFFAISGVLPRDEAIARVNDSMFGLQTGVFTNDLAAAWRALMPFGSRRIR